MKLKHFNVRTRFLLHIEYQLKLAFTCKGQFRNWTLGGLRPLIFGPELPTSPPPAFFAPRDHPPETHFSPRHIAHAYARVCTEVTSVCDLGHTGSQATSTPTDRSYSASSVIGFFATESAWKLDHNAARLAAEGHSVLRHKIHFIPYRSRDIGRSCLGQPMVIHLHRSDVRTTFTQASRSSTSHRIGS